MPNNDPSRVTIILQTADRTRKAEITVPRTMQVSSLISASTRRWFLSAGVDYQVTNLATGMCLNTSDSLSTDKVADGDVLMLQPFPTHGANRG